MLHVHRAERADRLADALSELLAQPLADPFAAEVVAVPTRGMERWLTQRMSGRLGAATGRADGICAGVTFPFPTRLLGDAVAAASGVDPDHDPWLPERAAWPLLDVVGGALGEPWLATLAHFLGHDCDPPDPIRADRRLTIVRHLAGLFHHYALHRPAMIEFWAAGQDVDALGHPLPPGTDWQAELWRRLRARIGVPGPAERRRRAGERLAEDPSLVELPARLSLFGLTRLPAGHLEVLRALAIKARRPPVPAAPLRRPVDSRRAAARDDRPGGPPRRGPDGRGPPPPAARLLGPGRARAAARTGRRRWRRRHAAQTVQDHPYPAGPVAPGCSGACRPTCVPTAGRPARRCPTAPTSGAAGAGRPHGAGACLPRARAPGRGDPRRDPARAIRGPGARTPRRDRHVPGRRGVRPADRGGLRVRGGRRRGGRDAAGPVARDAGRQPSRSAGAAGRPVPAPDQPDPRRRRRAARRSPRGGSPPPRCSTWPTVRRSAVGSAWTTTIWRACATGCPNPGSAGGWTPAAARPTSWPACARGPGRPGWSGCCSG